MPFVLLVAVVGFLLCLCVVLHFELLLIRVHVFCVQVRLFVSRFQCSVVAFFPLMVWDRVVVLLRFRRRFPVRVFVLVVVVAVVVLLCLVVPSVVSDVVISMVVLVPSVAVPSV